MAFDDLLAHENFYYAWRKAKRMFRTADGYIDHAELTEFELNLENELSDIRDRFRDADYQLSPLRPLPRPKKIDPDGKPIDRQYFHISVRDQVAWIALANVLGPALDPTMPAWSYGNRIYRAAWYDESEARKSKLEIGPYRHQSGHLYRKFQHSWPLFRRHVALTARAMARRSNQTVLPDDDKSDEMARAAAETDGLVYLQKGFWSALGRRRKTTDLFHASIDLKQFYPNIDRDAVASALLLAVPTSSDPRFAVLISRMLDFRLNISETPDYLLKHVEPPFTSTEVTGLPTGLFVAGFLANAGMLAVDRKVDAILRDRRDIAHFRFVDDHTIMAYDFEELCNWIYSYQRILKESGVGVVVNDDKYDPKSLGDYFAAMSQGDLNIDREQAKIIAANDTRIDGANPTRLLTKTLGQVSAIAMANVDTLDDDDLRERLRLLEWLLLADIPEREIRPDTRAAFAAGQIAALVPVLVQEGDGLIDGSRALADLESQLEASIKLKTAADNIKQLKHAVNDKKRELKKQHKNHEQTESSHFRRCFELLMQAFKEFPGKARLFYRLHQYCLFTGHRGLSEIAEWLSVQRKQGNYAWADYYSGLSLQVLSNTSLRAANILSRNDTLRSDRKAAIRHLSDIANIKLDVFMVPRDRESWFHRLGRHELAVSMIAAGHVADANITAKLRMKASSLSSIALDMPSSVWKEQTGKSAGVWAERIEQYLSFKGTPSPVWQEGFANIFDYTFTNDASAVRRYPELLPEKGWSYLLKTSNEIPASDEGWIRDTLDKNGARLTSATQSKHQALRRAAASLENPGAHWITAQSWVDYLRRKSSPFDPRCSEWTALEIVRQLISPLLTELTVGFDLLDQIHHANVLIPRTWTETFTESVPSWENWRSHADNNKVMFRNQGVIIADYRYSWSLEDSKDAWGGRLNATGRLLLGLLRFDFDAPRNWNIRGNEHANHFSRGELFQTLSISSPTLLLLEGCLSGRSAENRELLRQPGLFGWDATLAAGDIEFDAPPLDGPEAVLNSIRHAQHILVENQIAASMNQPRQLIPFRLADFAVGTEPDEDDHDQ